MDCRAQTIWAIDNDAAAIKIAQKNFTTNKIAVEQCLCCPVERFSSRKKFDLITANLLTQILVDNDHKLISRVAPGGYCAVSGISEEHYKWFRKNFNENALKCCRIKQKNGWVAILYQKSKNKKGV